MNQSVVFGLEQPDFSQAPMTIAWETTLACPLKCVHCRATAVRRRDPNELTTNEAMQLIDDAAEMGTKVFVITGGDPLARPDIWDLIQKVCSVGMHCGFSPSVTPRLTRDAIKRAIDEGVGTIHLSLDGSTAERHDAFRGTRGLFDRTMRCIDDVMHAGGRLQIGTTVARRTKDDLPHIGKLLVGSVDLWSLFFLVATGRAKPEDVLNAEENEAVLHWLAHADLPFASRTIEAPAYRRIRTQLGKDVKPGVTDGNGFCFVSHVGDVAPSGFLPKVVGNVRTQSIIDLYRHSELFLALRDMKQRGGKCGRCEFVQLCGGSRAAAWAHNGDALGEDPTCLYRPTAIAKDPVRH